MKQDHESLHAEPNQKVAVMVDLDELSGKDPLLKLKLGQIQVRPNTLGTSHLTLLLLVLKACCKQIRNTHVAH
jgi:hypothetical protein